VYKYRENFYEKYEGCREGERALVFFHGFPGLVTKNQDCAKFCSSALAADTYVFHYKGLGVSSGDFTFVEALENASSFVGYICEKKRNVSIIAHSFGCLAGIFSASINMKSIDKLVLTGPVLESISEEELKILLSETKAACEVSKKININYQKCIEEFAKFKILYNYQNLIKKIDKNKINVIAAQKDRVVNNKIIEKNKNDFSNLIYIDDNHWFENRREYFDKILGLL